MNKKSLKESETIELKRSTSELKEAIISIVAILNKHQKGELYFGITNTGKITGQQVSETTIRDVSKTIADHIEPKIYPTIRKQSLAGKSLIVVAFEGKDRPYLAYGRAYVRVGDENKQLSTKELEQLILKKHKVVWEEELSEKSIKDVNENTIKDFITKAQQAKRINFKFSSVKTTLNKLDLIRENKMVKATEVLFCDTNRLEVQAAVFAGTDKLTFLDIRQLKGNIFDLLDQSTMYLKEHMNWRAKLTGEGREEIPEVPVRAVEEAVVNSFCHRDYTNPKGNEIAFFKDRIEIYNPGQFPEDYTPEDFIKGTEKSILRNPLIANVLYLRKDIEKWGSGLRRIFETCKEADVKVEFKKLKSGFSVIFYRKERETATQKTTQKTTQKILKIIKDNPSITRKELSERIGITENGVKFHLNKFKEMGILKRIGPDKGGYWEIAQK